MLGQTLSHYKIVKQIGAGGMGIVYEAEDLILNRKVAIKTLKDLSSHKPRFLREARAISRINHPNIATIYDYGESEDEQPFIVMELVEGMSLDKHLKENPIVLSESVKIIARIADALTAAHQNKIIHRDIKPSNVIIGKDVVKVLDFGLSKDIDAFRISGDDASALDLTKTQKGVIMGTPLYLSPEQASGKDVDERTDIFSLGTMLYESTTGVSPFYSESVAETYVKILRDDPLPPSAINPAIPAALEQITLKALAKDPARRYQSAAELAAELRRLPDLSNEKIFTPPPMPQRPPLSSHTISQLFRSGMADILHNRYLRVVAFLLAGIIGVAVFSFFWFTNTYQPLADAKRSYDMGEAALNDGLYLTASGYFKRAIEQDGTYAMARARYAEIAYDMGQVEEAGEFINKANTLVSSQKTSIPYEDRIRLRAINSTLQSDFSSAVADYLELALDNDKNRRAQVYLDLGKAYERNDDIEQAIVSYGAALTTVSDLPAAALRLGVLYGRRQEPENSSQYFSRAEELYRLRNPEGEIETRYQRGMLTVSSGDASIALLDAESSLEKARINKIPYQEVKCLILKSRILRSTNKPADALPYAEEAVSVSSKNSLANLYALSLIETGTVYLFLSKYKEAEDKYNKALTFAQQYKIALTEKRALFQLGALRVRNHKADEALQYVDQVQDFFEKGGYRLDMLDVLSVKAQALALNNDYNEAFKIYQDLLLRADKAGDLVIKARALKGFGTLLADRDEFDAALDPLYKSFSIYNSINRTMEAGYSLFLHAEILAQLGRFQEADSMLVQADGLAQKNKALVPRTDLVRAKKLLIQARYEEAIGVCKKIFSEDPEAKLPSTFEARAMVLAPAYARSGRAAQAAAIVDQIDFNSDTIGGKAMAARLYLIKAEVLLANKQYEQAAQAARQAQQIFNELVKPAFEWQAWQLLARAQDKLKNPDAAAAAHAESGVIFSKLAQLWGEDNFKTYSDRPDIGLYFERSPGLN